jgi:hypothetical protein
MPNILKKVIINLVSEKLGGEKWKDYDPPKIHDLFTEEISNTLKEESISLSSFKSKPQYAQYLLIESRLKKSTDIKSSLEILTKFIL